MKKIISIVLAGLMLLVVTPCVLAETTTVNTTVTVNENNIIKESSRLLLGWNDDGGWQGRLTESAVLEDSFYEPFLKNGLNVPIIRGFFHSLDWTVSIDGENGERGYNAFAGEIKYGLAEWIKSYQKITPDCQFVITVNFQDDPENIANMVRYLTLNPTDEKAVDENGVNWAQKRVDAGIRQPVPMACFEFGNEWDMNVDTVEKVNNKYVAPDLLEGAYTYITYCREVNNKIKDVNPDAKTSILSYTVPHDGYGTYNIWNKAVILGAKAADNPGYLAEGHDIDGMGDEVDYIAHHYYYHRQNQGYNLSTWREYSQIMDFVNQLDTENKPTIFLSEHSLWTAPETATTENKTIVTGLHGALVTAEVLNRMNNSKNFGLATAHCMWAGTASRTSYGGHCWGSVRPFNYGETQVTAQGEVFKMFYDATGINNVEVACSGNNYTLYNNNNTSEQVSRLSLIPSAITTEEGGLNLIFANQNDSIAHNITLVANGEYKLEKKIELKGTVRLDDNTPDTPEQVIAKSYFVGDEAKFTGCTIEPMSVTVLYLVPMSKTYGNSDIKVSINDVTAEGIPTVYATNGDIEIECEAYETSPMAQDNKLSVVVTKSGETPSSANLNNIVYTNISKDFLRNRAYFGFRMPKSAENGSYTAHISNAYGTRSVEFEYVNIAESEEIYGVRVTSDPSDDYSVDLDIAFAKEFPMGGEYQVKVVNDRTGEIAHFGTSLRENDSRTYSLYMPKEAPSGKYTVYAGRNGTFAAGKFNFVKPKEKLQITGVESGNLSELADGGNITVSVKNISETDIDAKVFYAFYDETGKLLETAVCDAQNVSSQESADFTAKAENIAENAILGAVKAFVWEDSSVYPCTDFYIIKK